MSEEGREVSEEDCRGQGGQCKKARCKMETTTEEGKLVIVRKDVMTREEREVRRIEEEKRRKAEPKTFTKLKLKRRGCSWSPGKELDRRK